jgi:hypothetical protein
MDIEAKAKSIFSPPGVIPKELFPYLADASEWMSLRQIVEVLSSEFDIKVSTKQVSSAVDQYIRRSFGVRFHRFDFHTKIVNCPSDWISPKLTSFQGLFFKPSRKGNDSQTGKNRRNTQVDCDQRPNVARHTSPPL